MGILANSLNLSLDKLLHNNDWYQWMPFILDSPMKVKSMDVLAESLEATLGQIAEVTQEPSDFASVFNSLPLEYFMHHPHLMKFMYFKWGHYFVGTDEFNDYAQWELPERFLKIKDICEPITTRMAHIVYIWDDSLIWTLAREIDFFYKMHAINTVDRDLIKNDLKQQLTQLEKYIKGTFIPKHTSSNVSFYVSNINMGDTSWYISSKAKCASLFKTNFARSPVSNCNQSFANIKEWIDSLKNFSVLLSGSGQMERRLFFEKQHEIIDLILD